MARRRSKRRFRRIKPDMGWLVDTAVIQTGTALDPAPTFYAVFSFDDVDSDGAVITQDKSDWFIKRVIVDAYPVLSRPSSSTSAPARIWEMAIGTMEQENASSVTTGETLIDSDTYEKWRRLFKTYTRPVYATWQPYTLDGDLLTVAGAESEVQVADSPWGPSSIHDDFTVSNAGLVHNSAMYIAIQESDAVAADYSWNAGESVIVGLTTRVLLQKRRT